MSEAESGSICIENVGGVDAKEDLTPEQVQADVELVKYLTVRNPTIKGVLGHLESGGLIGSYLYSEKLSGYVDHKPDPGRIFMDEVRDGLNQACGK